MPISLSLCFFLSNKVSFENSLTFVHKICRSWCECQKAQSSRPFFFILCGWKGRKESL